MPEGPLTLKARAAAIFAGLTFRLVLIGLVGLLVVNTYVDLRIPIPLLPDIHWEGWKPKAQRLQGIVDDFDKAQEDAERLAKAALEAKEREYRLKAKEADDEHQIALSEALDATDRFIAANRVCPSNRSAPGPTAAAPESGGARVPESVPADSFVAVRDADVRACAAATAYAIEAHDWAVSLSGD